jgi:hypothetical protein
MYHLELRQFPHNLCRFNLSEQELAAIVGPWVREKPLELGERKWSAHQAKLTVLEGPRLEVQQLSMGRGWRAAQRQSEDVTERVLTAAVDPPAGAPPTGTAAGSPSAPPSSTASAPDARLVSDSLGLELLALLGAEKATTPLSRAWEIAAARYPERPASECLALAEEAVRSLLRRGLLVLLHNVADATDSDADGEVGDEEVESVLRAVESWTAGEGSAGAWMRRV